MRSFYKNIILIKFILGLFISTSFLSCNDDSKICEIKVITSEGGSTELSSNNVICGDIITIKANPEDKYKFKSWTINNIVVSNENPLSTTITENTTIKANFESIYTPTGYNNGHGYVDLGLSVKWAIHNIGASTPEERGVNFAWGEICAKSNGDWHRYKWCNGNSFTINKYNTNDGKFSLDAEDDVAYMSWGEGWRMPTREEINELITNCKICSDTKDGVYGFTITNIKNKNSIFLPVIGSKYDTGTACSYWSKSLVEDNHTSAYMLFVYYSSGINIKKQSRASCLIVRPVCE